MRTREILKSMFTENTGAHFLDSGDIYGRNWEKNQGVNLDAQPRITVEFSVLDGKLDVTPSINTYKLLADVLSYTTEAEFWDIKFQKYCERTGESGFGAMLGFLEEAQESGCISPAEDFEGYIHGVNSYNHEQFLTQQIQFCIFEYGAMDRTLILLQVHGGADVRGGYSEARVFEVDDVIDLLQGFTLHSIEAKGERASDKCSGDTWVFSDPYSGYEAFCGNGPKLSDLPAFEGKSLDDWKEGSILVIDGKAYSPFEKGVELIAI